MRKYGFLLFSFMAFSMPRSGMAGGPIFLTPLGQPKAVAVSPSLPVVADKYLWPSMDNLSKLYWRLGKFTIDDKSAIDGFLIINECDIYKNYFNNDIEWAKIRDAAAKDISASVATYPTYFEIMQQIEFGQYNANENYFVVTPDTAMQKVRRFEVLPNHHENVCNIPGFPSGYPGGLIVTINDLLTITAVPIKPEFASYYLQSGQENLGKKRDAYIRLKVHITRYANTEYTRIGDQAAAVFAHLDGIEIYSDPDKKHLLYRIDEAQMRNLGEIIMTPSFPDPSLAGADKTSAGDKQASTPPASAH